MGDELALQTALLNQLARSLTVPWITHYQSNQAIVRRSAACNLGHQISDCYSTETGRGGYKTTMLPVWQEGQITQYRCRTCYIQTSLSVSLSAALYTCDQANKSKTNWLTITVYSLFCERYFLENSHVVFEHNTHQSVLILLD